MDLGAEGMGDGLGSWQEMGPATPRSHWKGSVLCLEGSGGSQSYTGELT